MLSIYKNSMLTLSLLSIITSTNANELSTDTYDFEIVVTPTRLESPLASVAAPITKISREDLERWQPDSLADVLSRTPGLSFQSNGGRGQVQAPSIRGSGSRGLLLVIDGIPVRDLANGGADYSNFDPNLIESVEVYRGAHSSLYGPNAAGGIIYITTRQPAAETSATLSFMGGNNQTEDYFGQVTLANSEHLQLSVTGTHYQTEGNDVTLINFNPIDADDDGYWNTGGSINFYTGTGTLNNRTLATISRSSAEYDESSTTATTQNPFIEREQTILSNKTTFTPNEHYKTDFSFGHSNDTFSPHDSFPSESENQLNFVNWNHYVTLTSGSNLTLGGDYQRGELKSDSSFAPNDKKLENWAGYTGFETFIGDSVLSLSGRHDSNSDYGTSKTGSISVGHNVTQTQFIYTNYGTAFIAPSLSQLVNSPDLEPERSRTSDLGYRYTAGNLQFGAVVFYTKYVDKIVTNFSTFPATSNNIDKAIVKGMDLEVTYANEYLSITGSLTSQESGDQDDFRLVRTPNLFGSLDVDLLAGEWTVGGRVYAQSHTEDNFYNPLTFSSSRVDLPGFAKVDLRARYQFHPQVIFKLDAKNVFDRSFSTAANYQEQRLMILAGFELQI